MTAEKERGSGRGRRDLRVRVKTAKGRKLSSTRWLERQLNDPYVARARAEGWRSRAAFKLIEIDDQFGLLKPGARVVDLGAAPGGWTQVAVARMNALGQRRGGPTGRVLGDRPAAGRPDRGRRALRDRLPRRGRRRGGARLARRAAPTSCSPTWRHRPRATRRPTRCGSARWSRPPPTSRWTCSSPAAASSPRCSAAAPTPRLVRWLNRGFAKVVHVKPPASRKDSSEKYLVATGFRGRPDPEPGA